MRQVLYEAERGRLARFGDNGQRRCLERAENILHFGTGVGTNVPAEVAFARDEIMEGSEMGGDGRRIVRYEGGCYRGDADAESVTNRPDEGRVAIR